MKHSRRLSKPDIGLCPFCKNVFRSASFVSKTRQIKIPVIAVIVVRGMLIDIETNHLEPNSLLSDYEYSSSGELRCVLPGTPDPFPNNHDCSRR